MRRHSHKSGSVLVLHNIRSVHNVGSLFRTADAAGISEIILSGYTPAPVDRFSRKRTDFAKVSLGAEDWIPWRATKTLSAALASLRKQNYTIAAIEQDTRATSLFEWRTSADKPLAVVLGNEVRGLSSQALKLCDVVLEIPMNGKKESLNVSVAGGIALFELLQR